MKRLFLILFLLLFLGTMYADGPRYRFKSRRALQNLWRKEMKENPKGYYGNGIAETESNMKLVARCASNCGSSPQKTDGPDRGTAICGTYQPNDWGLYDMIGNVSEFCIDYWQDDITDNHDGIPAFIEKDADGNTNIKHVRRGGSYWNGFDLCNCWSRESGDDNYGAKSNGYRLSCSAKLTAPAE